MSLKSLLVVTITALFFQQLHAQRNFDEYNRLGLHAGLLFSDISTSDFTTEQGSGIIGGFTSRGSFRGSFDLIYGINFVSANVGILANKGAEDVFVKYTMQGAQVNFLGSLNIIKHHLSLEFGPILNINGKLKLNSESEEGLIINGYNELRTEDIQNIGKINFHALGGITAGLESFRAYAHYQYGVTNLFKNLNDDGLEKDNFEGHVGLLTVGAVVYF